MTAAAGHCSVPGCGRALYQSKLYCGRHRARWYRYGDPLGDPPPRRQDLAGRRFGALVAVAYAESDRKWKCRCDCGAISLVVSSSLLAGTTRSCGTLRRHRQPATYAAAHERTRAERGPASAQPCARCDGPAEHWAYAHDRATQRMESTSGPWSPDPADYDPLCVRCHKRIDLATIATNRHAANGLLPLW